jgi:hypothetical protein
MSFKRWLWVGFVVILFIAHLLIGTLVAIATAFYWLLEKRITPPALSIRCSDTAEIQSAFRGAWQRVFKDSLGLSYPLPEQNIIGSGLLAALPTIDSQSWVTLGVTPAHYKQLINATTVLAAAERLVVTPVNLKFILLLLDPIGRKPITQDCADATEEVIQAMLRCIVRKTEER